MIKLTTLPINNSEALHVTTAIRVHPTAAALGFTAFTRI